MELNLHRIKHIADYIEEHLKESLTLDDIAQASGISSYYLHHIFRSLTGCPLVQYIRNRKLSQSVNELLGTQMSLLDIAQEYGFEYQQSYSRAFKRHFDISPAQFRKNSGAAIVLTHRLELNDLRDAGEGILRTPVFMIKKAFYLVGIRSLVYDADNYENATANKAGVDFFYRHAPRVPNCTAPSVYYGYVEDIPGRYQQAWYQPSVEVCDLSCIPEDMHGVCVPTRRYAVFTYIGCHGPEKITLRTLADLYRMIFMDWICHSGEIKRDIFHFERIDQKDCGSNYCRMDMYIPVTGITS